MTEALIFTLSAWASSFEDPGGGPELSKVKGPQTNNLKFRSYDLIGRLRLQKEREPEQCSSRSTISLPDSIATDVPKQAGVYEKIEWF